MSEEMQSNPQVPNEQKSERVDELDVIGGGLLKLLLKGIDRVKQLFAPHPNS